MKRKWKSSWKVFILQFIQCLENKHAGALGRVNNYLYSMIICIFIIIPFKNIWKAKLQSFFFTNDFYFKVQAQIFVFLKIKKQFSHSLVSFLLNQQSLENWNKAEWKLCQNVYTLSVLFTYFFLMSQTLQNQHPIRRDEQHSRNK